MIDQDVSSVGLKRKYDITYNFYLDSPLLEEMKCEVKEEKGIYNSVSHFIRCAIIEKLRKKNA